MRLQGLPWTIVVTKPSAVGDQAESRPMYTTANVKYVWEAMQAEVEYLLFCGKE